MKEKSEIMEEKSVLRAHIITIASVLGVLFFCFDTEKKKKYNQILFFFRFILRISGSLAQAIDLSRQKVFYRLEPFSRWNRKKKIIIIRFWWTKWVPHHILEIASRTLELYRSRV